MQVEFYYNIICNDNGNYDIGFGKEIDKTLKQTSTNLKENFGARLPNAPISLQSVNIGLKFQLKMLEFIFIF
jgi:hypothetical protein